MTTTTLPDCFHATEPKSGITYGWLKLSPVGYEGGDPNLYRYVGNNPVTNTDPTGLRTLTPYDTLPAFGSLNPYSTASYSTPRRTVPTVDQSLRQLNTSIGTYDYYNNLAPTLRAPSIRPAPTVRAPSSAPTATVRAPSPPSGGFFDFVFDTASNYPGYLKTQLSTAGQTIVERGRSAGEFVGDHVSQLYYDPRAEATRVGRAAVNTAAGLRNATVYVAQNPLEATRRAGSAALNYADRLTTDPTVSGQLLGDATVAWGTGGTTAAGRLAIANGLAASRKIVSQIEVADAFRSLRATIDPSTRLGGIRLTPPSKFDVGAYHELQGQVPGLNAHHVGQQAAMSRFIFDYDPRTAPAILVPKVGHTVRGPRGIVSRSTEGFESARDVIARDIRELRRVYPEIPNTKLQELIRANKTSYPQLQRSNR